VDSYHERHSRLSYVLQRRNAAAGEGNAAAVCGAAAGPELKQRAAAQWVDEAQRVGCGRGAVRDRQAQGHLHGSARRHGTPARAEAASAPQPPAGASSCPAELGVVEQRVRDRVDIGIGIAVARHDVRRVQVSHSQNRPRGQASGV
jgi:hypothetical protein